MQKTFVAMEFDAFCRLECGASVHGVRGGRFMLHGILNCFSGFGFWVIATQAIGHHI
jgi:hypothetical protein